MERQRQSSMNLTGERKDINMIGCIAVILLVLLVIEVFNEK